MNVDLTKHEVIFILSLIEACPVKVTLDPNFRASCTELGITEQINKVAQDEMTWRKEQSTTLKAKLSGGLVR